MFVFCSQCGKSSNSKQVLSQLCTQPKNCPMQPSHDKISDITNKASESIMRLTVVELLEDAIALTKDGATPDQVNSFLRGVCITLDAARSISMAHAGEDGRVGVPVGALGLGGRLGHAAVPSIPVEELLENIEGLEEEFREAMAQWESERHDLHAIIEDLQAQIAQANAPKNGHRPLPVEDEYEDEGLEEEAEVVPPRRRSVRGAVSSQERVRGMLANSRLGSGRGFGRRR